MAAFKCNRCARYSYEEGCKLERSNYYQFRDCMTGRKSYWLSVNRQPECEKGRSVPIDRKHTAVF